ncbi:MAG: hypothetical protein AAB131_15315, partial [Actinomycetota bacterium]
MNVLAINGIGSVSPVIVDTPFLNATTCTGDVRFQNSANVIAVQDLISFGTGAVSLVSSGTGNLCLLGTISSLNGDLTLTHGGDIAMVGHVQAITNDDNVLVQAGGNITLTGDGSVAPQIEGVFGGTSTVSVFAGNNIVGDGVADATQLDIVGENVSLRAGAIGRLGSCGKAAGRLEIHAGTLTITDAAGTGSGGLDAFLLQVGGGIDIETVRVGSAFFLEVQDNLGAPDIRDTLSGSGIFACNVNLRAVGASSPATIGGGAGGALNVTGATALDVRVNNNAGGNIAIASSVCSSSIALMEITDAGLTLGPVGSITVAQTGAGDLQVNAARAGNGTVTLTSAAGLILNGPVISGGGNNAALTGAS